MRDEGCTSRFILERDDLEGTAAYPRMMSVLAGFGSGLTDLG